MCPGCGPGLGSALKSIEEHPDKLITETKTSMRKIETICFIFILQYFFLEYLISLYQIIRQTMCSNAGHSDYALHGELKGVRPTLSIP